MFLTSEPKLTRVEEAKDDSIEAQIEQFIQIGKRIHEIIETSEEKPNLMSDFDLETLYRPEEIISEESEALTALVKA